jgi:ATP-binding cassette subfamily B protein
MSQPFPLVRQRDQTDCGVACLLSVIRYYGGNTSLERLRELSGTTIQGTSVLGLYQAAQIENLEAKAFKITDLKEFATEATFPCILHVLIDEQLEHFVVCLRPNTQTKDGRWLIANPANGLESWTTEMLLDKWKTKGVLILKPNEQFVKVQQSAREKWLWLWSLIKVDAALLMIAVVLGIFISILGLSSALFSQKLIDDILPKHNTQKLILGLSVLVILLISKAGLGYLRSFFLMRQSRDFNNRIAGRFYDSLLSLPKSFFDTRKTGDLIARMNDTRRIQQTISYLAGTVFIDILVVLIFGVVVFNYSLWIGVVALLSVPVFGLLTWRYNDQIVQGQRNVMAAYARTESHYIDTITGISALKATNRTNYFAEITKSVYGFFQQNLYDLGLLGNRYNLIGEIASVVLLGAILALASWQVLGKELLLGQMMATISIAGGLIGSVARLATTNIQLQEARVAFERMYEFSALKPEIEDLDNNVQDTPTIFNSLLTNNLVFRFAGKKPLLNNVNMKLERGKIVALMGEVGSGKSIIIQILQQFQTYESGQIIVNDAIDFTIIPTQSWRKMIGVVPQEVKVFNSSIIENIILGNVAEEGEAAIKFCQAIGLGTFFQQLPQSYMTIVGEEGINLSGGQKQLIALARALYRKPQLLLLDEATSAMDSQTEQFVLVLLDKLKSEMGILMVTHRPSIAKNADMVYVLKNGII